MRSAYELEAIFAEGPGACHDDSIALDLDAGPPFFKEIRSFLDRDVLQLT